MKGRIHDVKIDFTGAPIRKGDVMATIYSQELVSCTARTAGGGIGES
jgi:hypothetical protein